MQTVHQQLDSARSSYYEHVQKLHSFQTQKDFLLKSEKSWTLSYAVSLFLADETSSLFTNRIHHLKSETKNVLLISFLTNKTSDFTQIHPKISQFIGHCERDVDETVRFVAEIVRALLTHGIVPQGIYDQFIPDFFQHQLLHDIISSITESKPSSHPPVEEPTENEPSLRFSQQFNLDSFLAVPFFGLCDEDAHTSSTLPPGFEDSSSSSPSPKIQPLPQPTQHPPVFQKTVSPAPLNLLVAPLQDAPRQHKPSKLFMKRSPSRDSPPRSTSPSAKPTPTPPLPFKSGYTPSLSPSPSPSLSNPLPFVLQIAPQRQTIMSDSIPTQKAKPKANLVKSQKVTLSTGATTTLPQRSSNPKPKRTLSNREAPKTHKPHGTIVPDLPGLPG
ncbi:hypothetical protein BLNAU_12521 [Blattamonas nauphoetae]|uniref:Uncharacterized protein n=1 Tax=Blattamonas nauphoetae TaxID=2049346 RepID=A0ABQ9XQX0_9EUKA|nr:hypothetical protein BLNAU_12521 [Blattamonas nauphoetae]